MSKDEQGYSGWANYPTWVVNLWLTNDEGTYAHVVEMLAEARSEVDDTDTIDVGVVSRAVEDYVQEELAPDLGATVASDLLRYALGEVDWYEIAEALLEE